DETPANDRSSSSSHFARMKALFVLSLPVSTDLHRTVFFFFSPLKTKPLDSIMDLDRSKTKSPKELTAIWYDYNLGRGHIGIIMKASHFIVWSFNEQPNGNNNIISFVYCPNESLTCFSSYPLLCYSIVERKWLHAYCVLKMGDVHSLPKTLSLRNGCNINKAFITEHTLPFHSWQELLCVDVILLRGKGIDCH
ncbi:hypothetical protein HID58_070604, partial [Brassica napus]